MKSHIIRIFAMVHLLYLGPGCTTDKKHDCEDYHKKLFLDGTCLPGNQYGVLPSFEKSIVFCSYQKGVIRLYAYKDNELVRVDIGCVVEGTPFFIYVDRDEPIEVIDAIYKNIKSKNTENMWFALGDGRSSSGFVNVEFINDESKYDAFHVELKKDGSVFINGEGFTIRTTGIDDVGFQHSLMDLSSDDDLRAPLILDAEKGIGLNTYLEMMGYLKHQLKLEVYIGKLGTE